MELTSAFSMSFRRVRARCNLTLTFSSEICNARAVSRAHYHVVTIRQMQFQPADLVIEKGDTVVWVNCDITAHDVTEETRKAWLSSPLTSPQSWMKVVSESADYYCSIHVVMKGRLRLQEKGSDIVSLPTP